MIKFRRTLLSTSAVKFLDDVINKYTNICWVIRKGFELIDPFSSLTHCLTNSRTRTHAASVYLITDYTPALEIGGRVSMVKPQRARWWMSHWSRSFVHRKSVTKAIVYHGALGKSFYEKTYVTSFKKNYRKRQKSHTRNMCFIPHCQVQVIYKKINIQMECASKFFGFQS